MEYKLIKKYPGSPDLGFIASPKSPGDYYVNYNWIYPEKYPEFWEKVVELDYEVLSLISTYEDKTIITYENGGRCYNKTDFSTIYNTKEYWIECFTKSGNPWEIYSIKRLSDSAVFSIGEKVNMFKGVSNIKAFRILSNNEFVIDFDNKCSIIGVQNISKVIEPVFTTHDNKPKRLYTEDEMVRALENWGMCKVDISYVNEFLNI